MVISIHALREEGDRLFRVILHSDQTFLSTPSARRATQQPLNTGNTAFISIHALREEGDAERTVHGDHLLLFLSTPSARRATGFCDIGLLFRIFLSTPSARRATLETGANALAKGISIHALREEGDLMLLPPVPILRDFYPRPPRGGRLTANRPFQHIEQISIHALREEGDLRRFRDSRGTTYFYPRPPRGGRLSSAVLMPP